MNRVAIKICGVTNVKDARACGELGADMIGLNFYPLSPRCVDASIAREIVAALPRKVEPVGVFVEASPGSVRKIAASVGFRSVQLHGDVSAEVCRELARDFRVIRALSVTEQFRADDLVELRDCDVLLDAPHPRLHGGTGTTCDWSAARAALPFARFLILSGGLNAQNISDAIATVQPHGVDVCSGVENRPGTKDHRAVAAFIAAAHSVIA